MISCSPSCSSYRATGFLLRERTPPIGVYAVVTTASVRAGDAGHLRRGRCPRALRRRRSTSTVDGRGAARRRARLAAYLEARADAGAPARRRGARLPRRARLGDPVHVRAPALRDGPAEATATIVHGVSSELGLEPRTSCSGTRCRRTRTGRAITARIAGRPGRRCEAGRPFVDALAAGRRGGRRRPVAGAGARTFPDPPPLPRRRGCRRPGVPRAACYNPALGGRVVRRFSVHAMKTWNAKPHDVERRWYLVDAEGETLGRLATRIADTLARQAQARRTRRTSTRATSSSS